MCGHDLACLSSPGLLSIELGARAQPSISKHIDYFYTTI
jgi:hypothetical protein